MSVMGDALSEQVAKTNNEMPVIQKIILVVDGLSALEQDIKLTLLVKEGHGKQATKHLDQAIKNLITACENYNKSKKGEGDGTYKTALVTSNLGL